MLSSEALDCLFRQARTANGWLDKPVSDQQIHELYELMKWAPTSANSQPARFVFLRSSEAKERLRPALSPGNVDKTMAAPVVVIIAHDTAFHERLPEFFPHNPAFADMFRGEEKRAMREAFAFRNGSLQGAYLIMAARSIGLDCGPMSGFDQSKVDAIFFPDSQLRSNFLCNLGYGDPSKMMERLPRMPIEQACQFL
ncbi:MAG: malonic semialdehyde reductase [Betaproteobacteria bacterium]|nr:malonic semialdehyde reductase [Pseudomonadota bacterium]NBO11652.1 malonic semialdehyde reductase [Betaproteobacteria bacterium]NBO43411.1 malonic semialdehyde reductase [Betaproteobacteria bacterium]NBP10112.1 malonic semialdehyde reductase [Betaproteobacteria bacterium]NBP61233.1 malonic semialdehyde reductase [Betaproteobacteria bacterium]